MFDALATAAWTRICRAGAFLRAFALLEDGRTTDRSPAALPDETWAWAAWPDRRAALMPTPVRASPTPRAARAPAVAHPHRRHVEPRRRSRRPGTPPPAPMVCLSPVVRRVADRRDEDRRRSRA
jgi:hypothetical protein